MSKWDSITLEGDTKNPTLVLYGIGSDSELHITRHEGSNEISIAYCKGKDQEVFYIHSDFIESARKWLKYE